MDARLRSWGRDFLGKGGGKGGPGGGVEIYPPLVFLRCSTLPKIVNKPSLDLQEVSETPKPFS